MKGKQRAIKGNSHSFRIACDKSAVSLLDNGKYRYIKVINNNYNTQSSGTVRKSRCSP